MSVPAAAPNIPDLVRLVQSADPQFPVSMEYVTSGRAWRSIREQGRLFVLPSGNICRVRNVPLDLFLKLGRIPNSLLPVVAAGVSRGAINLEEALEFDFENPTAMKDSFEFMDAVVRMALVAPRVVDENPADDEILIEDMEFEDKAMLVGLLGLPSRALERFCEKQSRRLAVVPDVPDDEEDSIFPPEPQPVVEGSDGPSE